MVEQNARAMGIADRALFYGEGDTRARELRRRHPRSFGDSRGLPRSTRLTPFSSARNSLASSNGDLGAPAYAAPRARLGMARPLRGEALLAFLVLNALNVLDALLTWYVLNRGLAVEGNPVIGVISLPGKIALVALAGWFVAHLRPRALPSPIVALALVALWTLTGVVLATG